MTAPAEPQRDEEAVKERVGSLLAVLLADVDGFAMGPGLTANLKGWLTKRFAEQPTSASIESRIDKAAEEIMNEAFERGIHAVKRADILAILRRYFVEENKS